MQRISGLLPSWDQTSRQQPIQQQQSPQCPAKPNVVSAGNGLGKVFSWAAKRASNTSPIRSAHNAPPPLVTTRASKETFWPSPLDKECDKAARILKSFCYDGFFANEDDSGAPLENPQSSKQILKKIPSKVIQDAVALAVFTCVRSGLWITGSGGSGVLIARKADGTWSPPSGIMLHTPVLSFVMGADIYDCVLIIKDFSVLETFTRPSITLGTDVSIGTGPLVNARHPNEHIQWSDFSNSVFSYLKSRGQNTRIQLDGSVLTERGNENERFYGSVVSVLSVLAGEVRRDVPTLRPLTEMLKAAEGRTDFDMDLIVNLSREMSPGDMVIESPKAAPVSPSRSAFGVPDIYDPDPFGVLALEMAGLEIREAGTKLRPTSSQFEYNPAPTSPLFAQFHQRQSVDTLLSRSNRGSYMSNRTLATERTQMTDACTQTEVTETSDTTPSPSQSEDGRDKESERSHPVLKEEEDFTKIDTTPIRHLSYELPLHDATTPTCAGEIETDELPSPGTQASSTCVEDEDSDGDDEESDENDENEEDDEEPVVFEVATATPPPRAAIISKAAQVVHIKGALVNIPKRIPPPLPTRSPARLSRTSNSSFGDINGFGSPLKQSFIEPVSPVEDDSPITDANAPVSPLADIDFTSRRFTASELTKAGGPQEQYSKPDDSLDFNVQPFNIHHEHSFKHAGIDEPFSAPLSANNPAVQQQGVIKQAQAEAIIIYSSEDSENEEFKTPNATPVAEPGAIEKKKEYAD